MKVTPNSGTCWYIKWVSTILVVIGGILAATSYTPENFILTAIGGFGWMIVGIIWKDRSIIILNAIMGTLSIVAFLNN